MREAIGLMFNFEWSNQTLFYGLYARINSVWENTGWRPTGVPTPEEVAILQPLVDEGLLPASILTDEAVMAPTSGDAAAGPRQPAQGLGPAGRGGLDRGRRRHAPQRQGRDADGWNS